MVDSICRGIEVLALAILSMLMVLSGYSTIQRKIKATPEQEVPTPNASRQMIQEDLGLIRHRIQQIEIKLDNSQGK